MALTESNMMELGKQAPDFYLPDAVSKEMFSLENVCGKNGTVVMWLCNHCPYVIHVNAELVTIANHFTKLGIGFVAISANDAVTYPDDSFDKMGIVAKVLQYPFPYLYDESQEIAKAYDAACTPDIFVFEKSHKLYYRGRLDGSRPGNEISLTGEDLREALDLLLTEKSAPEKQYPSMGCNIKWKS